MSCLGDEKTTMEREERERERKREKTMKVGEMEED